MQVPKKIFTSQASFPKKPQKGANQDRRIHGKQEGGPEQEQEVGNPSGEQRSHQ